MHTAWEQTRQELRAELGAMFDIWVDPLHLHGIDRRGGTPVVHLVAPNEVYVSWLEAQYLDTIQSSLRRTCGEASLNAQLWVDGAELPQVGNAATQSESAPASGPDASTAHRSSLSALPPTQGVPEALFPELALLEADPIELSHSTRTRGNHHGGAPHALPQAARRFRTAESDIVPSLMAAPAPEAPPQPTLFDRMGSAAPTSSSSASSSARSLTAPASKLLSRLPAGKTFERFVVGGCNQFAHAAAQAVGDGPTSDRYNPLFIYGGTGLGKTHLMVAVGHRRLQHDPTARVLYVTAEQFTNELIEALRFKRMLEFRDKYRKNVDLLLMDDIQFVSGKERTMEELFHTFRELRVSGRQIVFTADVLPREIKGFEPRLLTRCESGMLADMQPPDHETLVAILHQKAASASVDLSHEVARWIAARVRGSIREIEGVVHRLAALCELYRERASVGFVRAHLGNVLPEGPPSPEAQDVLQVVAETYDVQINDLLGRQRVRRLVLPRHVAMFLVRKHTGHSFPEIGRRFRRDHTTVQHACRKIESRLMSDVELRQQVHIIERTLGC